MQGPTRGSGTASVPLEPLLRTRGLVQPLGPGVALPYLQRGRQTLKKRPCPGGTPRSRGHPELVRRQSSSCSRTPLLDGSEAPEHQPPRSSLARGCPGTRWRHAGRGLHRRPNETQPQTESVGRRGWTKGACHGVTILPGITRTIRFLRTSQGCLMGKQQG